jgi:hypothetical protein
MRLRFATPGWGLVAALAIVTMCAMSAPSHAQPKKPPVSPPADKSDTSASTPTGDKTKKAAAPKTYDFNALDLNGRMRSPQLLYFLERANEELERASLEKRSFIPHMVRSLEEEAL